MSTTATEQNTSNGKGEKCRAPKDFDGNEAKYKTWLRMTETYFRVNSSLFPDDAHKIDFALSFMNTGRAADWAEHFTDTHTKDGGVVPTTFMINYRHLPARRHPHCLMNL